MKPLIRWALLIAVPLLFVFALSASAGPPPTGKVKHKKGWIPTIAMDGARVAYNILGDVPGVASQKVYVWNVRTGRATLVAAANHDDPIDEIAIAGTRVAWIARDATAADPNSEVQESLFVSSLTQPRLKRPIATAYRSEHLPVDNAVYSYDGDWIGGLVGSKSLLAVGRWSTSGPGAVTQAELDLLDAAGLRARVTGSNSIVARSTDGRRVAVLRSMDAWPVAGELLGKTKAASVGVYSASGRLLREINAKTAEDVALSGSNLVVLTKTKTLVVYNWRSGRLLHRWNVPTVGTTRLEDAYASTAVYSVYSHGRNLHLVQLSTGKDAVVTKGPAPLYFFSQSRDAQLEAPGLVYAVDKGGQTATSKLVFVPMARVLAVVSAGHVR